LNNGILKIKFEEFRLDNGLTVLFSEDNTIPSVAINLCYKVGSKDEDPDKRGFAHLFEHLMYEGSKNVPNGEYDKYCIFAGGENNGYTNEDKTNYYIVLPSHQLELGLWLESDRMAAFSVSEESLKKQKEVVIEEKKQMYDNKPYGSLGLEFPPRLYQTGGYMWDTIGDAKDISSASIEDVKNFFENFYLPNNAVLSITGDFDRDSAKEAVVKYFGDIRQGKINRKQEVADSFHKGEIKDVIYDKVQFPGLFMAYKIPRENSKEHYVFEVLSEILSTGESSRLYKSLVYEKQLVSEIWSYVDAKEFAGVLYIFSILMPGVKTETVEAEVTRIIHEIKDNSITESELSKVKNKFETAYTFRLQSIVNKGDLLAHYKSFHGNAGLVNSIIDRFLDITLDDIHAYSNIYLRNDNRVILNYLPRNNK
jgi:predicted Zn-dependent peptidase